MNVRIDRLDALERGGRAILDYKSGRRSTADWYGERPSHPQLLAYLAAVGGDVTAMATVNVTAREVRFDGIASSGQLLPKVRGVEPPVGNESGNAWEFRRTEWRRASSDSPIRFWPAAQSWTQSRTPAIGVTPLAYAASPTLAST